MESLLELSSYKQKLSELISNADMGDCLLPLKFKEVFKSFGEYKIGNYNKYTLVIFSKKSSIIIPNQWVFIAGCCCQFHLELVKYRQKLISLGINDEIFESCHPSSDNKNIPNDQKTLEACRVKAEQSLSNYKGDDKQLLVDFLWNYELWGGGKNIKRANDFTESPILNIANTINASSGLIGPLAKGLANQPDALALLLDSEQWKNVFEALPISNTVSTSRFSLQQIFYGAPGTGKSHTIKECTEGKDVIRTTFHPDTDYSTFVGAYKPTTKSFPVTTVIGTKAVAVEDKDGKEMTEDKIVYEFVPQAFLQAYVAAWQKFDKIEDLSQPNPEYLVIEEINRGNCAQIFGDLFQLLDRGDGGFSEYPIKADADMKKYLQKALKDINLEGICTDLNGMFKGKDIASQVKEGDILLLPNNLYIWATMNTSDQSLFPIDSAFKRRWDWKYVPICDAGKKWVIRVNGNDYSWWNFLEEINKRIYMATYSEDKKLGYFFCKAKDGKVIDADMFVSKVVFYLWNDVFKDMEFEGDVFKDGDNGKLSFDKFYTVEAGKTKVVSDKVELFLKNLKLVPIANADETEYEGQEPDEHADEKREWSETELKRYEFWKEFLEHANKNEEFAKYFGSRKTPSHDKWYNFPLGHPDCYLVAEQTRSRNELELQVYFNKTTANYHQLLSHKHEIEEEMGVQYEWNELPNKKASKITETKKNVNLDEKSTWPESFDFFIDRLLRMRVTFLKYLNLKHN